MLPWFRTFKKKLLLFRDVWREVSITRKMSRIFSMAGVSAVVARGSNEPMVGWPRDSPRPGLPAPGLRAPGRGGAEAGGREVGPGHGRRWHQPTIGRVAGAGSDRGTVGWWVSSHHHLIIIIIFIIIITFDSWQWCWGGCWWLSSIPKW